MEAETVTISVSDDRSSDESRLDESVLALRRELSDVPGVRSVTPRATLPGERARSASAHIVGSLLVSMSISAPSVTFLIRFLHEWLRRNDGKRITVTRDGHTIDLAGLSDETIKEILSRWDLPAG
jgi:Effector Associated Constant Component 1